VLGDPQPGGLLEPVGGEVHPVRELAELLAGADPQGRLGQCCGDVLRLRGPAEPGLGGQGVEADLDRLGGLGEEVLAVVGEQPAERVEVHPAILPQRGSLALIR
jgi:hypothetical protein